MRALLARRALAPQLLWGPGMNTSNLVALLACLSTVPACAVSTGSPASGAPATSGAATPSAPSGDWSCLANPPAETAAQPQDKTTTTTPPAIGNSLNVHLRAAYTFEDVGNVQ